MTTQTEVWLLFFATAIGSGFLLAAIVYGVWLIRDRLRCWLIVNDEDSGYLGVHRVSPKDGKVTFKPRKGQPRVYFLNAKGRKGSNRGGAFIVDAKNGCTLVGPNRVEWEAIVKANESNPEGETEQARQSTSRIWGKMRYLDPIFNFHVLTTHVAQDFLRAREEKAHWIVGLAVPLMIVLVLAMAIIGFLAWKLSSTTSGG